MFAHSKGTEQNIKADLKHYSRDSKKTCHTKKRKLPTRNGLGEMV